MANPVESRVLLEQWRAGDQQAARQLFDRYAERLLVLARRRIGQRLASRVDPEDVVQSVFLTFFARAKEGRFRIEEQNDLAKLLVRITVHKTLRQVEFHTAAKRDFHQQVGQSEQTRQRLYEVFDSEPTPQAVVECLDQMEHFFSQFRPDERKILELRLQGFSTREIAKQLGSYDRKIRRVLEHVRGLAAKEELPW